MEKIQRMLGIAAFQASLFLPTTSFTGSQDCSAGIVTGYGLESALFSLIRATCPAHLILLDLIILIVLNEECKL
jgi:hypothetical protein